MASYSSGPSLVDETMPVFSVSFSIFVLSPLVLCMVKHPVFWSMPIQLTGVRVMGRHLRLKFYS